MAERLKLREGFTTGSAASGACVAALALLLRDTVLSAVNVPLPPFDGEGNPRGWLQLPVNICGHGVPVEQTVSVPAGSSVAHAAIVKDGGDDPDVTSGLAVYASVSLLTGQAVARPDIGLVGGPGVGRVTLPGLPVRVGEPAINPVPREQIRLAIWHWLQREKLVCPPLVVTISVPGGAEVATKTFNPRLGIVGGISILGTQGTVRPYSHDAFRATIAQGLEVAHTMDASCVFLSTGRRSEKLLMAQFPHASMQNFVQVADFAHFSLERAGLMGFGRIVWGCFFGKLLKLAQGLANTHAHEAQADMTLLATLCREKARHATQTQSLSTGEEVAGEILQATTAAQALEILLRMANQPASPGGNWVMDVIRQTTQRAAMVAARFARQPVDVFLFHTDGRLLCGPVTGPEAG